MTVSGRVRSVSSTRRSASLIAVFISFLVSTCVLIKQHYLAATASVLWCLVFVVSSVKVGFCRASESCKRVVAKVMASAILQNGGGKPSSVHETSTSLLRTKFHHRRAVQGAAQVRNTGVGESSSLLQPLSISNSGRVATTTWQKLWKKSQGSLKETAPPLEQAADEQTISESPPGFSDTSSIRPSASNSFNCCEYLPPKPVNRNNVNSSTKFVTKDEHVTAVLFDPKIRHEPVSGRAAASIAVVDEGSLCGAPASSSASGDVNLFAIPRTFNSSSRQKDLTCDISMTLAPKTLSSNSTTATSVSGDETCQLGTSKVKSQTATSPLEYFTNELSISSPFLDGLKTEVQNDKSRSSGAFEKLSDLTRQIDINLVSNDSDDEDFRHSNKEHPFHQSNVQSTPLNSHPEVMPLANETSHPNCTSISDFGITKKSDQFVEHSSSDISHSTTGPAAVAVSTKEGISGNEFSGSRSFSRFPQQYNFGDDRQPHGVTPNDSLLRLNDMANRSVPHNLSSLDSPYIPPKRRSGPKGDSSCETMWGDASVYSGSFQGGKRSQFRAGTASTTMTCTSTAPVTPRSPYDLSFENKVGRNFHNDLDWVGTTGSSEEFMRPKYNVSWTFDDLRRPAFESSASLPAEMAHLNSLMSTAPAISNTFSGNLAGLRQQATSGIMDRHPTIAGRRIPPPPRTPPPPSMIPPPPPSRIPPPPPPDKPASYSIPTMGLSAPTSATQSPHRAYSGSPEPPYSASHLMLSHPAVSSAPSDVFSDEDASQSLINDFVWSGLLEMLGGVDEPKVDQSTPTRAVSAADRLSFDGEVPSNQLSSTADHLQSLGFPGDQLSEISVTPQLMHEASCGDQPYIIHDRGAIRDAKHHLFDEEDFPVNEILDQLTCISKFDESFIDTTSKVSVGASVRSDILRGSLAPGRALYNTPNASESVAAANAVKLTQQRMPAKPCSETEAEIASTFLADPTHQVSLEKQFSRKDGEGTGKEFCQLSQSSPSARQLDSLITCKRPLAGVVSDGAPPGLVWLGPQKSADLNF